MASTIVFRRGSTFPSQGSGITLAEPVFNTSQNTFHIGLGHGVTAEWVGAPITGLSASIASGEAYKIPTAAAVKNYVTDYVTAVNGVLTVNGFAGGVTLSAGTGVSVAASSGSITITNTGVQSFNGTTGAVQGLRFVNGKTGDIAILGGTNIGVSTSGSIVTVNNEGVLSVDGSTGAVNNVARTNTANTFTQLQTFSNASGISASQVITKTIQLPGNQSNLTLTGALFSDSVGIRLFSTDGLGGDYHTTVKGSVLSADRTITFPDTTGTVALTSQLMGAVNGSTAATTAVTSFNGSTGAVQGVSAAVAGTGISVSGTTGSVTITNTGVQSFNGSTGPVGISAGTGISITQSGTTYTIASTGGGGSKTYERFTPLDNQPPASNFATIDTRNSIMVLDFADSSADESAIFVGVIPEAASLGSGLKVRIIWMATSATSGSVRWGVQFMNLNTDLDSDSFDTATEGNGTANGTNGTPTTTELTVTNIDSLTAGDFFRLKIYREQSDTVNDTMTGDAELIAVEVRSAS